MKENLSRRCEMKLESQKLLTKVKKQEKWLNDNKNNPNIKIIIENAYLNDYYINIKKRFSLFKRVELGFVALNIGKFQIDNYIRVKDKTIYGLMKKFGEKFKYKELIKDWC